VPGLDVVGEERDHRGDQRISAANPLGVPGLLRHRRERVAEIGAGEADPVALRGEAEQLLRDHEAEQLDVVQARLPPRVMLAGEAERGQDAVVEVDIECGQEGVEVLIHT
jgi:hypothetical protein